MEAASATGTGPAARAAGPPVGRWMRGLSLSLLPWTVVVGLWEVAAAAGYVPVVLFPPPSHFLEYLVESKFEFGIGPHSSTLWASIFASFMRVLAGMARGFFSATVVGVLISMSTVASRFIMPIVRGLAPIAPIAWIPLGIVLFGVGNGTALFVVWIGVFFILVIATTTAVAGVDPRLIKSARTLGATTRQVWLTVIFPAILPQVFTLLRLNFFAAWMAVLAAEMVGLKNGLGAIIILGREMFNTDLILIGMCLIGVSGYAVDSLLLFIQRRILWWTKTV